MRTRDQKNYQTDLGMNRIQPADKKTVIEI